jgi:hypothetical protein
MKSSSTARSVPTTPSTRYLWNQAQDVWGGQLRGSLKCLVSIGTGVPALKLRDDVPGIWATLKDLATETEKTAEQFRR